MMRSHNAYFNRTNTMLLEFLKLEPHFLIATTIIFALLIGSFLNVVIHRLPKMMEAEWRQNCNDFNQIETEPAAKYNLVVPRSACPHCGHAISALENIPILSYAALGGKCRGCKASISLRYPFVEALTGTLAGFAALKFGYGYLLPASCLLIFALIALTFIDFDTFLLPDSITLPLLWLGILFNLTSHGFTSLPEAVIGAVAGYMLLWSIYWGFKLLTGREGMGYGDFKLLAALGAWFGWQMLPSILLLASILGSIAGVTLMIAAKRGRNIPIPFGPYLALGGIAALFFGQTLQQFYFPL